MRQSRRFEPNCHLVTTLGELPGIEKPSGLELLQHLEEVGAFARVAASRGLGQGSISDQAVNVEPDLCDGLLLETLCEEAVPEDGAPDIEESGSELKSALLELGEACEHQLTKRGVKRFNVPQAAAVGSFVDLFAFELKGTSAREQAFDSDVVPDLEGHGPQDLDPELHARGVPGAVGVKAARLGQTAQGVGLFVSDVDQREVTKPKVQALDVVSPGEREAPDDDLGEQREEVDPFAGREFQDKFARVPLELHGVLADGDLGAQRVALFELLACSSVW